MGKIPHKFTLGGTDYTVRYEEDYTNGSEFAHFEPVKCEVVIHRKIRGVEVNENTMYNSFLHEMTHAILGTYGFTEQNDDEKFVNAFASGLTQVFLSAEYE